MRRTADRRQLDKHYVLYRHGAGVLSCRPWAPAARQNVAKSLQHIVSFRQSRYDLSRMSIRSSGQLTAGNSNLYEVKIEVDRDVAKVRNTSKPGEFGGQLMTADSRVFRPGVECRGVEFGRCRPRCRHYHLLMPASGRQPSCLGTRFR